MFLKTKDFFNFNEKLIKNIYENKDIQITVCKNNDDLNKMIKEFLLVKPDDLISLDFEFNQEKLLSGSPSIKLGKSINGRRIAIFQINIETKDKINIFLFYPPDLNANQKNDLIKFLTNDSKKIIHGGESLDIPYLFTDLLVEYEDKNKFCKNLIDTKYLCEYKHLIEEKPEDKCKIYLPKNL